MDFGFRILDSGTWTAESSLGGPIRIPDSGFRILDLDSGLCLQIGLRVGLRPAFRILDLGSGF